MRQPRYPTVETPPSVRELRQVLQYANSAVQSVTGDGVDNSDPKNPVFHQPVVAAYPEGAAFPASPISGQKFYRTDLNLLCYYDGVRWLTCDVMRGEIAAQQFLYPLTGSGGNSAFCAVRTDIAIFMVDFVLSTYQAVTGTTSNFWTVSFDWLSAANAATSLGILTTKTNPNSGWLAQRMAINGLLPGTARALRISATPSGSPGVLYAPCYFTYRHVLT